VFKKATYQANHLNFVGQWAYDDARSGKSPAILMGPTWTGPGEYTQMRATALAKMGYVVLVADIYSEGAQPARGKESAAAMDIYMKDRAKLRQRMQAAYDVLSHNPLVDAHKIVALGYCFGGTAVLELARDAAPLAGVVVFHGMLDTPNPADAKNIKSPVIVFNGADDPNVPHQAIEAFEQEMRMAKVDLQFINYSGTKHAFTDPSSGTDQSKGSFYNPVSDARSWGGLQAFLQDLNLNSK
jgi:dienelactone hydrolase